MSVSGAEDGVRKAIVVGAGPVGCLAAISLAKAGWQVDIYEARPDLRLPASKATTQQRSINLAISSRGIAALQAIDAAISERFLQTAIPMRGRMIHDIKGNQHSQLYDKDGQCIYSIDRALLNEGLLSEASMVPNIRLLFRHKVLAIDFDDRTMIIRSLDLEKDMRTAFHFCIGADGSYSIVRRQLMRVVRMNFQQEYIPHEYIELKMPAVHNEHGKPSFSLDPNHLHIWPRHSFMLIALPNKDCSFTCTLFAPTSELDRLATTGDILSWFKTHFSDALALLGEERLSYDFANNPRSPLITIKAGGLPCITGGAEPYHYRDRCVIIGDAAHAMVPFYGQGLNCGFEDVRVLQALLQDCGVAPGSALPRLGKEVLADSRLSNALSRYTETRHEDLVAICDLAMYNYIEMRHSVTTPVYLFKKALDDFLYTISSWHNPSLEPTVRASIATIPFPTHRPSGWIPLYTMVTFRPDISYGAVRKKAARQSEIVTTVGWLGAVLIGATGFYWTLRVLRSTSSQR
ncbi:hypothetical protein EDD16DRAFT_1847969 [Pisolithus croceorrhizus]|nr:hypothetical protein EDD16DRAFT_1847969 [Pisolithus croceorrhizus]KAI6099351.1 hypothetical protein EV401DRAFT_1878461 [Pisolithus croceorrhizus]